MGAEPSRRRAAAAGLLALVLAGPAAAGPEAREAAVEPAATAPAVAREQALVDALAARLPGLAAAAAELRLRQDHLARVQAADLLELEAVRRDGDAVARRLLRAVDAYQRERARLGDGLSRLVALSRHGGLEGRDRTVLRALAPVMRDAFQAVARDLEGLERHRAELAARRAALQAASSDRRHELARLAEAGGELSRSEESLRRRLEAARARVAATAADQARRAAGARPSLGRGALAVLAPGRAAKAAIAAAAPPAVADGPDAAPGFVLPIAGPVVSGFGEGGLTGRGIVIEGRPGQTVTAPRRGTVVFAGHFKSFGLLLIIDHGNEYHSLLAGMSRLDVVERQGLRAGDVVGILAQGGDLPKLYVELRRNGQPINPLPWLAGRDNKVRG